MNHSLYLERAGSGSNPVRKQDADIIRTYLDERVGQGLGGNTAVVTAEYLVMMSRALDHPFGELTTKEIMALTTSLTSKLKQNTRRRLYPILRGFLTWLNESGYNTSIDLEKINKIKTPGLDSETKKASEMFTADEIKAIIEACTTSRDRALIAMMFEGALRPIEMCTAQWEDLNFDKHGATFNTSKKTGKPRFIRLIWSAPYLLSWKNDHPDPRGEMSVFTSKHRSKKAPHHRPITQSGIKTLFYDLQNKIGIPRRAPYFLRHSRITSMIADEIPESAVKMLAWGSLKSNMLSTYAHLTNADVDRILLQRAGIVMEEKKPHEQIKPVQCPNCGIINKPTAKFCDACGRPLTEEAVKQVLTQEQMVTEMYQKFQEEKRQSAAASY